MSFWGGAYRDINIFKKEDGFMKSRKLVAVFLAVFMLLSVMTVLPASAEVADTITLNRSNMTASSNIQASEHWASDETALGIFTDGSTLELTFNVSVAGNYMLKFNTFGISNDVLYDVTATIGDEAKTTGHKVIVSKSAYQKSVGLFELSAGDSKLLLSFDVTSTAATDTFEIEKVQLVPVEIPTVSKSAETTITVEKFSDGNFNDYDTTTAKDFIFFSAKGDYVEYKVNVEEAGAYMLKMNRHSSVAGGTYNVFINGGSTASVSGNDLKTEQKISLVQGINTIKIVAASTTSSFNLWTYGITLNRLVNVTIQSGTQTQWNVRTDAASIVDAQGTAENLTPSTSGFKGYNELVATGNGYVVRKGDVLTYVINVSEAGWYTMKLAAGTDNKSGTLSFTAQAGNGNAVSMKWINTSDSTAAYGYAYTAETGKMYLENGIQTLTITGTGNAVYAYEFALNYMTTPATGTTIYGKEYIPGGFTYTGSVDGYPGDSTSTFITLKTGFEVKYSVYAADAGYYKLSTKSNYGSAKANITVSFNGETIDQMSNVAFLEKGTTDVGSIYLKQGHNLLTIVVPNGSAYFNYFTLVPDNDPSVTLMKDGTVTDSIQDGTMSVSVCLPAENHGKNTLVIFAIYKGDEFYKLAYDDTTKTKNVNTTITIENVELDSTSTYTYKVFYWKDWATIEPLYAND